MISIIGSGRVGSSIAFLCVSNALDDVVLLNRTKDKAVGEALDIASAIPADSKFSIWGTDDYSEISESKIVIISASTSFYSESRTENLSSQVELIKEIAEKIKQHCPSAIVLVISNPLDVLTYFFQKESGFSRFKVIGVASSLDTSRFRYFLSKKFSVAQSSITNALVLGEHGETMFPIFSGVTVDGKNLLSLIKDNERTLITYDVRNYWRKLRNHKSRSQFGIAKNAYDVIEAITNEKEILIPASIVLEGEYGEENVALGIPVKINENGVSEVEKIHLDDIESDLLKNSAEKIREDIQSV